MTGIEIWIREIEERVFHCRKECIVIGGQPYANIDKRKQLNQLGFSGAG